MDTQELQKLKNKYDIVGNDDALGRALQTAVAVAPTDLSVLILGESGTGKETIPQIIHQHSRRRTGKYLAVNCGAIPEGTINSELFGHEKGSFTGAVGERKGYFEEANGGTLFLDEIGDLPRETQALLLRVLQNGEFIKVGSAKVQKTDVRVIAATNVNLAYAVATGKFREDLYYRLTGVQISLPALRDRNKDDIYLLFRKFSSDFAEKYNLCKLSLTHEAINMLTSYRWPGNIRQLRNIAEAVTGIESRSITPGAERVEIGAAVLFKYLPHEEDTLIPAVAGAKGASGGMSDNEKQMIVKAILDLKQEVDSLKAMVQGAAVPAKAALAPVPSPIPAEQHPYYEPEDQSVETEPEPAPKPSSAKSVKAQKEELFMQALERHAGNTKLAAEELGVSERTIYRFMANKKKGI